MKQKMELTHFKLIPHATNSTEKLENVKIHADKCAQFKCLYIMFSMKDSVKSL